MPLLIVIMQNKAYIYNLYACIVFFFCAGLLGHALLEFFFDTVIPKWPDVAFDEQFVDFFFV